MGSGTWRARLHMPINAGRLEYPTKYLQILTENKTKQQCRSKHKKTLLPVLELLGRQGDSRTAVVDPM